MDIATIARMLGGNVTGRNSCNVPGPDHSPRDRSLAIKIGAGNGFVLHSHSGDDWMLCRDYVRGRLGLADDWKPDSFDDKAVGDDQQRRQAIALRIWNESIDPRGTLVEIYLRKHRGLTLPDVVAGSVIGFHRRLHYDRQNAYPGMVCLLRDIKTDEPTGIHRTFLNKYTAAKIDRRMLGVAKGAAIKFDAPSTSLTIGEGVETVLTAREAGFAAAWALGSSGAVRAFPVVRNVRELTILAENDPTSERDVKLCARRYLDARRPVRVVHSLVGNDLNDAWRAA
jgi:hypothetical protein